MSDIFREVEEEVRNERYLQLWKQWGPIFIGIVAVILVGAGGYTFYQSYMENRRADWSTRYLQAAEQLEGGDLEAAAAGFAEVAEDTGGAYRTMAQFQRAAALQELGRLGEAREIYRRVAASGDAPQAFRRVARLNAARMMAEDASLEEVRQELGPLLTEATPWRAFARELEGYVALRTGQTEIARERFAALATDLSAPGAVRERAGILLQTIPRAAATPAEDTMGQETQSGIGGDALGDMLDPAPAPAPADDAGVPQAAPAALPETPAAAAVPESATDGGEEDGGTE